MLPSLPFACISCTVHFFHMVWDMGSVTSPCEGAQPRAPQDTPLAIWCRFGTHILTQTSCTLLRHVQDLGQTEAAPVHSPVWLRSFLLTLPFHFLVLRWFELRKAHCRPLLQCAAALPGWAALTSQAEAGRSSSTDHFTRAGLGNSPPWSVRCLLWNKSLVSSLLTAASVHHTIYCIPALCILMAHNRSERHPENAGSTDKC